MVKRKPLFPPTNLSVVQDGNSSSSSKFLAGKLTSIALSALEQVPKKCLPLEEGVGKNGSIHQWGVACCAIIYPKIESGLDDNDDSFQCIAIGGGSKCMPRSSVDKSPKEIIHDSHAEVLCRRSVIRWFLIECLLSLNEQFGFDLAQHTGSNVDPLFNLKTNNPRCISVIIDEENKTISFKFTLNLAFYITQSPCGSASMLSLDSDQSEELRKGNESKRMKYLEENNESINKLGSFDHSPRTGALRGRLDYNNTLAFRTKPGRIDSPLTGSMSCSDKILRWNALGLLGRWGSPFIESPIFLNDIVVDDYYDEKSLFDALYFRGIKSSVPLNKPRMHKADYIFNDVYISNSTDDPDFKKPFIYPTQKVIESKLSDNGKLSVAPVCFNWDSKRSFSNSEVLVNGRIRGFGINKKTGVWSKKSLSELSIENLGLLQRRLISTILKNGYTPINLNKENSEECIANDLIAESIDYKKEKQRVKCEILQNWVGYK